MANWPQNRPNRATIILESVKKPQIKSTIIECFNVKTIQNFQPFVVYCAWWVHILPALWGMKGTYLGFQSIIVSILDHMLKYRILGFICRTPENRVFSPFFAFFAQNGLFRQISSQNISQSRCRAETIKVWKVLKNFQTLRKC